MATQLKGNSLLKAGDRVEIISKGGRQAEEYIVAIPSRGRHVLINMHTGTRWAETTVEKRAGGKVSVLALVGHRDFFNNYEIWLMA
jgi:hypothetical protein